MAGRGGKNFTEELLVMELKALSRSGGFKKKKKASRDGEEFVLPESVIKRLFSKY